MLAVKAWLDRDQRCRRGYCVEPRFSKNKPLLTYVPARLRELIDSRVFEFAQAAQRHYRSNDLVMLLDLNDPDPTLEAVPRERLAQADELGSEIQSKFAKPAGDLKNVLGAPDQSFWFMVFYEDGDADVGAINASMLAPGGTA